MQMKSFNRTSWLIYIQMIYTLCFAPIANASKLCQEIDPKYRNMLQIDLDMQVLHCETTWLISFTELVQMFNYNVVVYEKCSFNKLWENNFRYSTYFFCNSSCKTLLFLLNARNTLKFLTILII